MVILGIDPGLQKLGWGIISNNPTKMQSYSLSNSTAQFYYIASGLIKTKNKDHLNQRIWFIFQQLQELFKKYKIDTVAIENTYVNENYQSSLYLSHARAAAIIACMDNSIHPIEYQAKTIKKTITGSGNASKEQVTYMLSHCLDAMPQVFESSDVTDALAIAICHGFYYKSQNRVD